MRNFLDVLKQSLGLIILIPVLLVIGVGYLLFVPFDIIRYHKMSYYKDFKKKYEFFLTSSDVVKIYNRIVKEQLPIEYVKNNDYEYFVKDGQVLLCGWGNEDFEQINDEWIFSLDDDSGDKTTKTMEEALFEEKEFLKPEHKDLPTKFLIFYNDIADGEIFEKAKECPYFYCIFSADEEI